MKRFLLPALIMLISACAPAPRPTITPTFEPTNTPVPTATAAPKTALETVLITNTEINEIINGNMYNRTYVVSNDEFDQPTETRLLSVAYMTGFNDGYLYLTLAHSKLLPCKNMTKKFMSALDARGEIALELPKNIFLPDETWLEYNEEDDRIYGAFSVDTACTYLEFDLLADLEPDEATSFLAFVIQKQALKLKQGGY